MYKIKSHEQVFRTEILVTYETQVTAHLHKNHKSYGLTEQCPIYYNPAYSLFPDRWVCSTLASSWRIRCQKDKRYLFTKAQKQFFHLLTVTSENLLKAPLKVMCLHSQATERTELSPQTPAHENVSLKIPTCHSNADKLISTGDWSSGGTSEEGCINSMKNFERKAVGCWRAQRSKGTVRN